MVNYKIFDDYIQVFNGDEFNIQHILECGQVFRYKNTPFGYTIYSADQKADIYCQKDSVKIFCKNKKFFIKYFDLDTNYDTIKSAISGEQYVDDAIKFGYGIRILKSDPFEMIISFIISANNNIPRIKATIDKIVMAYGSKIDDYYAFPTAKQLALADEQFFKSVGCGYRSAYLVDTVAKLVDYDFGKIETMSTDEAKKELLKFKGIGPKVADCILLFGFNKADVFPTDTWIVHTYESMYGKSNKSVKEINKFFTDKFGKYSGYAQQYLFYSQRENNIK